MGPATDEGYYFDFDATPEGREAVNITVANFPKIEKRMGEIIKKNLPITRHEISVAEARTLFADNPYKQEWIDGIEAKGEKVTVYWTGTPNERGSMVDLCKGPHVTSTGQIQAFKLLSIAVYTGTVTRKKMLTRCQPSLPRELMLISISSRSQKDHRKLDVTRPL
jgi:threonyl-tRNA synthetase